MAHDLSLSICILSGREVSRYATQDAGKSWISTGPAVLFSRWHGNPPVRRPQQAWVQNPKLGLDDLVVVVGGRWVPGQAETVNRQAPLLRSGRQGDIEHVSTTNRQSILYLYAMPCDSTISLSNRWHPKKPPLIGKKIFLLLDFYSLIPYWGPSPLVAGRMQMRDFRHS